MNFITSQERVYPSVFIAPTIDLTSFIVPNEKGVIGLIAKLPFGNPHYPVILKSSPSYAKTTLLSKGGIQENEAIYHINDFFSTFNGKMSIGRLLGTESKTKVLEVKKVGTDFELDDTAEINIFGANNIKDWQDTVATGLLEIVINTCISEKHTIEIKKEGTKVSVKLYDINGGEIYKVSGDVAYDSVDDSGTPDYIGDLSDPKIITVKTLPTHADIAEDFSIVKTFENGLVTETGTLGYDNAIKKIESTIETTDYIITAGLRDVDAIKKMGILAKEHKNLFVIDLYGNTKEDVKTLKTSLNLNNEFVTFIWNREKDVFKRGGSQNIGLSGWYVGACWVRNLKEIRGDIESRLLEGIIMQDYPIPREKEGELEVLSSDDKTFLYKERINPVAIQDGKLVMFDILSGNPKSQTTAFFPVVEGKYFIDRYITRLLITRMGKNATDSREYVERQVRTLFRKLDGNKYFSRETGAGEGTNYQFAVTVKDYDTIKVDYQYVPNTIIRRGYIQGSIVGSIEQKV